MQRRWEPWRWGPWGLAIGSYDDEYRRSSKLIFLPLQKRLKNSALTIPRSFHIWKEVERWKGSVSGCLMSWLKIKKNFFWNAIFSYCMQHTISWLDCDVWWKVDLYDNQQWPAQWLDWEEAPKHFSKPNLHQKKVMVKKKKKKKRSWSLFGSLLPVWSITTFWIAVKPLHLRSMFSKLMRCTKNCNVCRQHWSTERAQFSTTPDHTLHKQCFKSWTNWAMKFCLIRRIHLSSRQLTTTSSSVSVTVLQGKMLPQPPGGRTHFARVHRVLKHGFVCYGSKQICFSLAKMYWL